MGKRTPPELSLEDGSRIAVIGGGPAGSFFSYFFLKMAQAMGTSVQLDIYEPRDFSRPGPAGCNMCGGIVSERLVQSLAAEGIYLGPNVIQRSIDSYALHMDVGDVRIATPFGEKRIAAVHRGGGPRGIKEMTIGGLDGYLLELAAGVGARVIPQRIDGLSWDEGRPHVKTQKGEAATYDLVTVAVGVNSSAVKLFEEAGLAYKPPRATKTYICEFCFTRDMIRREMGHSMHVFLLNIPRLEFAALIPKGDYVTLCMLGRDIDRDLVREFLEAPEVKRCLPPNWTPPPDFCHCSPKINIGSAKEPFADRIVFIGDCGATRLYKDGIGAAYRTAKTAARTAIFQGVSAENFRQHYWPVCKDIERDNQIGQFVFAVTRQIQKRMFARRGVWLMVSREQRNHHSPRRMSTVLWDTFTGSAPYKSVLLRTLHPGFFMRFGWEIARGLRQEFGRRSQ